MVYEAVTLGVVAAPITASAGLSRLADVGAAAGALVHVTATGAAYVSIA